MRIARWSALLVVLAYCSAVADPVEPEAQSGLRPWTEYRTIMWIGDSADKQPAKLPLFFQRLREMGINTAMVHHDAPSPALLDSGLPFYVENMVNRGLCLKYHSKVTDWEQFVTGWARTRDPSGLLRDYSLDDPKWRSWAGDEMADLVKRTMRYRPVAYDLRDELSVTVSANPFDYDFSEITLTHFREWLRTRYADLGDLNRKWETSFDSWSGIKPFTTDRIKARMAAGLAEPKQSPDWGELQRLTFNPAAAIQSPTRWNFAPWADFRTYIDVSLARTLADLRRTSHALDPATPVGIEGTQMPSAFGGYDLWRLSRVLDWVEPYDIANARELFGSFMVDKPILTTVGEKDAQAAARRVWHLLLLGDRGCLVWWSEDCIDWNSPGYDLTARARNLAPVLKEMTSPLARLFLQAERQFDPIAIHYSQPSIQADWLLESIADGSTWLRRFSSFEADHNRMVKVRNSWLKALQDLGYSPRFVSSEQIESGELENLKTRVLVLPDSLALSEREAHRMAEFIVTQSSPVILCDGIPGLFDEHAKLRLAGPPAPFQLTAQEGCSALTQPGPLVAQHRSGDVATYAADRLAPEPALDWPRWIQEQIGSVPKDCSVPIDSRTRVHRYRLGDARLLALERNVNYQMSEELRQAGGNQLLETAVDIDVRLARPAHLYDLRSEQYLGFTSLIHCHLEPWRPALFALLDQRAPGTNLVKFLSGF